jgi:hypothetical protein
MVTLPAPTLHDRIVRAPFRGLLLQLLALTAVVVGLVAMSPAAQGWGESVGTPHVHAAHDLHGAGTGHGVGDSRSPAEVEPASVAEAPAPAPEGLAPGVLVGAGFAASAAVMLLAALGMAVLRALRRLPEGDAGLRDRLLPRAAPAVPWALPPPTPAALSVFRI